MVIDKKIWGKGSILINIEFDSEPVYGNNYEKINANIKSYGNKVNTDSSDNSL